MPQPTLYWEDFKVGETAEFGSKHVTKEEILEFATEFDPQPFHLDEEAARQSILGGLCASGWHSCAMVMRMMCDAYVLESAALGAPGVEEVRWMKPVFVDDTLNVKRTCMERRPSNSRLEMGLTRFQWDVFNQNDVQVMQMTGWAMFARRHPGEAA